MSMSAADALLSLSSPQAHQWVTGRDGILTYRGDPIPCFSKYRRKDDPGDPENRSALNFYDCQILLQRRKITVIREDVRTLDLMSYEKPALMDKEIHAIFHYFPKLRFLGIPNANITDQSLMLIAERYPWIESLSFQGSHNITDKGLHFLAERCTSLVSVNLNACPKITDDGVIPLLERNPKLRKVMIAETSISDKTLFVLAKMKDLDAINLSSLRRIGNPGLFSLANGCRSIQFLILTGVEDLSREAVVNFSTKCSKLRTFNVSMCKQFTEEDLDTVIDLSPYLEDLSMCRCVQIPTEWQKHVYGDELLKLKEERRALKVEASRAKRPASEEDAKESSKKKAKLDHDALFSDE